MKKIITYCMIVLMAATAVSCNRNQTRKKLMPNISGKPGEVVVVIGKDYWEGTLGGLLRDSLACDFPYLPQSEPMFDLVNVAPAGFTSMFQLHRNIIVFNIRTDVTEPGILYKNDQWAAPQCVIKINAPTEEIAADLFLENCEKIKAVLEQAERARVIANTKRYEGRYEYDRRFSAFPIWIQAQISQGQLHLDFIFNSVHNAVHPCIQVSDRRRC